MDAMDAVEVTAQLTPNPNAIKFTVNRTVAAQGKTYRDAALAETEWARQLLAIEGIVQVFAVNNFISVTKKPEADWQTLGPQAEQVLRRTLAISGKA